MATLTISEKRDGLDVSTEKAYSTSSHGSNNGINALLIEPPKVNFIGSAAILARSGVPESHRSVADNFMIIKKIFGSPVVQCKIANEEREFLAKFDFYPLEFSTAKQTEEELAFLKKWSCSRDKNLQMASDKIIGIRSKELKYIIATNYKTTSNVYNGYRVLEKYFEDISKYFSER